jgi:hypothetical protein
MATTSGSSAFNLDLTEIVEEAFERVGSELRTGYDLKTARRSLNLMFTEWANRGVNMWTFEQGTIPFIQGLNTYTLPNDTVDLLEHVIRTQPNQQSNQADLSITRISVSTYATIPNKLTQARPIQVWIQRLDGQVSPTGYTFQSANIGAQTITLSATAGLPTTGYLNIGAETIYYGWINNSTQIGGVFRAQNGTSQITPSVGTAVYVNNIPRITVWPTPDQGVVGNPYYQFVYWRMRRVQDAGGGVNVMDVPFRFIPCMTAGLAYHLALKVPGGMDRLLVLKQQYDEAWQAASDEDREKAAIRFVPRRQYISGAF